MQAVIGAEVDGVLHDGHPEGRGAERASVGGCGSPTARHPLLGEQSVPGTRARLPAMVAGSEKRDESGVYDVIIVGGRPAGASLAIWLGRAGLRVLIVDQARFPSPHPVSAPFLLPHALAILDELGLQESVYAKGTPKITSFVLEIGDYFRSILPFESDLAGRDYFYTIDRSILDHALWQKLGDLPTVRALEGTKLVELLKDEQGGVLGVILDRGDGAHEQHHAGIVVGADGRFSTVARSVGAATTEERDDVQTTVYFDHWQSIKNYNDSGDVLAQIYSSCDGFSVLGMPTVDDQTIILVQGRADRFAELEGDPESTYMSLLRARPRIWRRLEGRVRIGELAGMKRIKNLFREPGGPGWALCGDAYHQKDSIDAQGIYDALAGAKILAQELLRWHRGDVSLATAVANYGNRAYAACKPMFDSTMQRLEREIYSEPPPMVAKTMMRWMMSDPEYGRDFARLITRQIDPASFLPPSRLLKFVAKGALRRVRRRLAGADPTDPYVLLDRL